MKQNDAGYQMLDAGKIKKFFFYPVSNIKYPESALKREERCHTTICINFKVLNR